VGDEALPLTAFHWHCLRRDLSNFALLKYRDCDGFLVTMQHSGTHWLKYMLSVALARQLGLEPPRFVHNDSSNDFIGHPRHPRRYPQAPRIASAHSVPHSWFDSNLVRGMLRFPPYVVVVRDLRAALVSNYEKWKARYAVSFSEYLRGDPRGKRYVFDVWGGLHFLNRWARVRRRFPSTTLVLRYEDIESDAVDAMRQVFTHFSLAVAHEHLAAAAAAGSKTAMATRLDPASPVQNIIRDDARPPSAWYSAADRRYFDRARRALLQDDFGYDWRWSDVAASLAG